MNENCYRGNLIVVGGRPETGKTTFALNVVNYFSTGKDVPCLYYSIKETKEEIEEMLIHIGGDETYEKLRDFNAHIHIEDNTLLTVDEFCAVARAQKEKNNIELIVIDYFQLLILYQLPKLGEAAVRDVLDCLKNLAKELEVAIIVLSELGEDVDLREDKKPVLSDIPNYNYFQDKADIIVLLHREESDDSDAAEIIVAKNENGDIKPFI